MINNLPGFPDLAPKTIYCIGRNYADHALELNNPVPSEPVIFSKPATSLLENHGTVIIPNQSTQVHHEAELVLAIGKKGKNIPQNDAISHVSGIAAGIDITARDIQSKLKEKSLPWLLAKGLDTFAPIGTFISANNVDFANIQVQMFVNDELKQDGNTKDLLFPVDVLVSRLSEFFTLLPGDLIYTGTPAGVGPLKHGDKAEARILLNDNVLSTISINVSKG